jgi:outer membrane protein assembly factor BamB
MLRPSSLCVFSAVLLCGEPLQSGEWTRFRGADGAGVAPGQRIPEQVGVSTNLLWKVTVPEGISSPIIVGHRLFLTSHSGSTRNIHCLNAGTGASLWQQALEKQHDEIATRPAGPSTPTPVSDGQRLFVFFPDTGLSAWTLDGEPLWNRPADVSKTMHGLSSSLVCFRDHVYLVVDQLNDSSIAAYSAETGDEIWKQERLSGLTGGYSTPVIYEPPAGSPLLVTTGPFEVVAYDPVSGERIWWILGRSNAPCSSPVLRGETLYFCETVGEKLPMSMIGGLDANKDNRIDAVEAEKNEALRRLLKRIDDNWGNRDTVVDEDEWNKAFGLFEGKGGLTAISLTGRGDVSETSVLWSHQKGMPYIPGVLVDNDVVFAVNDGGIVTTVDARTGKEIHKGRLRQGNAEYYSSPVAAGGHVVMIDTAGVLNIISNQGDWKPVSHCELGEPCHASPAIADNRLYVRTAGTLFCFGEPAAAENGAN